MPSIRPQIRTHDRDVDRRLLELGLTRAGLLEVVRMAMAASRDVTEFHAANAAGTFAYQAGTFGLRRQFVSGGFWSIDRRDGVESIRNDESRTKVVFCNVDIACDDEREPQPRSRKGAGSERACSGNLFDDLPIHVNSSEGNWRTFFLMVDSRGAAELTCAIVENGEFVAYPERIYLSDGGEFDQKSLDFDDGDIADDFDPPVTRK